jgi:hypothetical protein
MPPYGEPDWASPGDTTNTTTAPVAAAAPAAVATNGNSGETRYVESRNIANAKIRPLGDS